MTCRGHPCRDGVGSLGGEIESTPMPEWRLLTVTAPDRQLPARQEAGHQGARPLIRGTPTPSSHEKAPSKETTHDRHYSGQIARPGGSGSRSTMARRSSPRPSIPGCSDVPSWGPSGTPWGCNPSMTGSRWTHAADRARREATPHNITALFATKGQVDSVDGKSRRTYATLCRMKRPARRRSRRVSRC